jgi:uncharacterized protein (DUF433 family)
LRPGQVDARYDDRAMTDMSNIRQQVVHSDPEILGGMPVFVGTRVPVKNLLDYLKAGDSLEEFLTDFPTVTREQAEAAIQLAGEMLIDHARAA